MATYLPDLVASRSLIDDSVRVVSDFNRAAISPIAQRALAAGYVHVPRERG